MCALIGDIPSPGTHIAYCREHEVEKRENMCERGREDDHLVLSLCHTTRHESLNISRQAVLFPNFEQHIKRSLASLQWTGIAFKMPKKDTQNKAWAEDKNKFGLKMLEKMGWKGKGLGKNEDGLEQHVKVSKRSANLGLGTEDTGSNNDRIDAFAGQRSWERTNSHFSDVLASLNSANKEVVKKIKKLKKKKSKNSIKLKKNTIS